MRKFWVIFFTILVVCTVSVAMIFVFSTRETLKLEANVMYVNVGDEFELNVKHTNKDNSTTITASSSDASIVSFDNGLCVAKTGGVARITFTTSNARYRNLYCDIMVGDGSMENPYYISSAEEFAKIGQPDSPYTTYACYKLVADIDLAEVNNGIWTPVAEFTGKLDGNGYTIKNMVIGSENEEASELVENGGLFGIVSADATIYNIKFDNAYIFGTYTNVGTVAGINYGVIERVEVKNTFLDVEAEVIGGVVGRNITTDSGNLINDRSVAVISKTSANVIIGQERKVNNESVTYVNKGVTGIIGGIAGQNIGGKISNTYSVGKVVLGESNIVYGGLVGDNQYAICSTADSATNSFVAPALVENSYSAISLFSNKVNNYAIESIGGVVGQNSDILEEVDFNGVIIDINSNNLSGLYYDKNKLNISETSTIKMFDGVGNNIIMTDGTAIINNITEKAGYVLGCTTNIMKAKNTFKGTSSITEIYDTNGNLISTRTNESSWDFENVWQLTENINSGYPHLTYIYIENTEEDTVARNYVILNTYTLTISQGNADTEKAVKGLSKITIKDNAGEVVKESTASSISFDVVEGFRVSTNSKGIVVYDLDGNVYYNITFTIVESNYKFSSIALDNYLASNNGSIKENGTVNIWFRNTNHTLTIIDSKTNKTIKNVTVAEGTSLSTYINSALTSYSKYQYVRFNTQLNGTGSSYSATSKMPSKDLTLYVLYSNSTGSSSGNDFTEDNNSYEDDNNDKNTNYEDSYEIACEEDWNDYVVKYGDNDDVSFIQTKSFVITSNFEPCDTLAGNYDGNGYTIEVRGSLKNFAIFNSVAKNATVTELNVKYTNATIRSLENSKYFGGIANECKGIISDCNVSGTINLDNNAELGVAGIVGHLYDGYVVDCRNSADVSAESQIVAGIVASMRKGNVSACSNTGDITNESSSVNDYDYLQYGTVMASGIVGYMYGTYAKTVESNENSGAVLSQVSGANNGSNSAGIVAYVVNGDISDNSNDGTIESAYQAGGIVAYSKNGDISGNTNTGNVIASTEVFSSNVAAGGIVGKVSDDGSVTNNTHRSGKVVAECTKNSYTEAYAGGIIGCMFYGGTAKNNTLSSTCIISATGSFAYAAGGVGRICEKDGSITYSGAKFVSGWSTNYTRYVTADGSNKEYVHSSANMNDAD